MSRFCKLVGILVVFSFVAGSSSTAMASHPSRPLWRVELQSVSGPRCLPVYKDDDQEGVFEIRNMCGETLTIESVTCNPEICEFDATEIPSGAAKPLGPASFGLEAETLTEGDEIYVELTPELGGNEQSTYAVKFTFDGWSDASHGMSDASGNADVDSGGGSEAGSGDAAVDDGDGYASGVGTGDGGGCSTAGSPTSPLPEWLIVTGLMIASLRRRTIG